MDKVYEDPQRLNVGRPHLKTKLSSKESRVGVKR